MADTRPDAASAPLSPAQTASAGATASAAALDRKTVQALYAALRTSIPADVQKSLLRDSLEELKFLLARQPRLSSFHHRRRESLRHPALAMATKNYYQLCRRKRLEYAVQFVTAEQQNQTHYQYFKRADAQEGQTDNADMVAAQRESEMVDILLAEYAQAGDFQEEYGRRNQNAVAVNIGDSLPFSTGLSFGSRGVGGNNAQLLGSISAMEVKSETSLTSESRVGDSTFFTDVGNASLKGTSGVWRSGQSIMHHRGASAGNHAPLADGTGLFSPGRSGHSFSAGNTVYSESISGGGYPRGGRNARGPPGGASRFFSKRHDRAEGGPSSTRCGSGRGDGGARWSAEMLSMVVRRAEEELQAGSGGDPYLLTSSRPIEILLTCYAGVRRDPAVMALGAASFLVGGDNFSTSTTTASPADADPVFNAVVEEDVRWDQLAQCYRQLLREANSVRQAAASVVAHDTFVNDILRRFWERLTVSPAARLAHKAQEAASRKRDATDAAASSKGSPSRIVADEAEEDDLDEIQTTIGDEAEAFAGNGGGGGGAGGAKPTTRKSPRSRKGGSAALSRTNLKGKGKGKKRKSSLGGFSAKAAEPASTVAYYMTPLQYVYLHTRMAHVLLPDSNALDMELLYFIQEDLLVDAAYNESDAFQTLYFGEAPHLVGSNGLVRSRGSERRLGGKGRFAPWQEDDNAANDDDGEKALTLRQRFLAVRRHGYELGEDGGVSSRLGDNISVMVRRATTTSAGGITNDEVSSIQAGGKHAGSTVSGAGGGDKSKETPVNALSLVNMCFSIAELPSLTYQQFWCSMMELADNWTCCAGHPVETAIFLWELYAEVFGLDWGPEDEAFMTELEEKAAQASKLERSRMEEEVTDALRSFEDLVQALRERDRESETSSSDDSVGGLSNETAYLRSERAKRRRRRRRKSRKNAANSSLVEGEESSLSGWSASDMDLSLTAWNAVAGDGHQAAKGWVYFEQVGEDGVKRRYRRRVVHCQTRRHKAAAHPKTSSLSSSLENTDELSFILEEDLREDGTVVKRRKRRCKEVVDTVMAQGKRRRRLKPHGKRSAGKITSTALYEHRRKYDEDNAKQLRRLEDRRRVETGSSRGSSLTSWSSIDDGNTDDRRNGQRRRRRVRRTGPRRDRLRSHSRTDDDASVQSTSDDEKDGKPERGKSARRSRLTSAELQDLQENKEWLCTVLGAKGICLPPPMFDIPAEQVLLYELLRLTRENEAKGGGGTGGGGTGGGGTGGGGTGGGPSGEGLFNVGEGEGSGGTDLSRLAALLAQSTAFNLAGLDDSALMRRLLGEDGDESGQALSPHQLQIILLALAQGQRRAGGAATIETEGMRRRRLYLLRMLEEQQERERQSKEDAGGAALLPAGAAAEAADSAPRPAKPSPAPPTAPPPYSAPGRYLRPSAQDGSAYLASMGREMQLATRIPLPPPPRAKLSGPRSSTEDGEWVLSPATAAERRELERLFRELEAYWADRVSQRGRYRVHIVEYTKEQLEEFFAHLHLGSRQRALLRGRAPLAAATSLVGGTLHQDTPRTGPLETSASRRESGVSATVPAAAAAVSPFTAAPVKLFTLTTEASLDGALRESYQSYFSDKVFSKSCKNAIYKVEQPAPAASPPASAVPASGRRQPQPNLPPLSQSGREHGRSSPPSRAYQGTARQSSAPAAAPPSPQLPAKSLPTLAGTSTARLNQSSSSSNSTNVLPKV
ncbi:hypothetical protein ABB37_00312 [Leptomonas pyrrhocoris]|uniref:Uncharacterized protein n=1 Tax=Leptomonas pyrrhocoris TaxID=157538 RepID=A0A0M9GAD1_LEPPY|nr:hypothetical protein ABB37_00312 [Leptomonas pyrrhocoris]KPA86039.1 hypothetical protein ABB37_00312 [Leptomonas pyrrhocoris]|eukprot:XP_015664478.1 hypothetical protein ABB37_00312 [Leptomonas pyrrhocoris]